MLAQLATFAWEAPAIDFHALAPEIIVVVTLCVVLLVDVFTGEDARWTASSLSGIGLLLALIPIATLAYDGTDRVMFGGAYVVDDFALVLKALFLVSAYLVILLSTNYIAEGDYWEGEYYLLVLGSVLGMVVMASSRDLISMFVALEMLSIPAYMLAAWRKRDVKGNEAGLKYYLMGVFASAIMLYGMSLLYGLTGSTLLSDIGAGRGRLAHHRPARHPGHRVRDHRLRLQGVGRAVPLLGARHLRGRTHPGHRVPRRGLQGGRVRGPALADLRRLLRA